MRGTRASRRRRAGADNAFNFVVSPAEPVRITIVDRGSAASGCTSRGRCRSATRRGSKRSSRQADALSRRRPAAQRRRRAERRRRAAPAWRGGWRASSSRAAGCSSPPGRARRWPQDVDLLPATLGNPVDRTRGDAARVGALEYGHPVFEPFRAPRSGDFSSVRVYGYRSLTRGQGRAGARALRRRRAGRCSSGASATAACCCGPRRSTCRGATCRRSRCSCRSCIARCGTSPATPSRSRG